MSVLQLAAAAALGVLCSGCGSEAGIPCGPGSARVARVIDGDTIELADAAGTKVRYLLVDTPESTGGADDCWGEESKEYNRSLVEGQAVSLAYDVECTDRFDRLLAYVSVGGREINSLLVERGHACVLFIPPNGEDRKGEFEALEATAKAEGRGMWGACGDEVSCD